MKKLSIFGGSIDQLENQGTPGHNTVSTRQKIPEKEEDSNLHHIIKNGERSFVPQMFFNCYPAKVDPRSVIL